jgi:hypothetical protein
VLLSAGNRGTKVRRDCKGSRHKEEFTSATKEVNREFELQVWPQTVESGGSGEEGEVCAVGRVER